MKQDASIYIAGGTTQFHQDFELLEVLGRGQNSLVRVATSKQDGSRCAVKIIHRKPSSSIKNNFQVMAQMEIDILQKIKKYAKDATNFVQLKSVYEDENTVYLVLELLEGGELFEQVVARGSYTEKDASALIKMVVSGIKSLHEIGIIHRDLKPENLVFQTKNPGSSLKIIDFGHSLLELSNVFSSADSTSGKRLIGTLGYLAPEVVTKRQYTQACDIWSIGVIMYILLCGYPPFYSHSNNRLLEKISKGSYEFHQDHWGSISNDAKELVRRMLEIDPSRRISSQQILDHPWIAENNMTVDLPDTIKRLGTFNARRKLRAAAMACVWGAGFGRRFQLSTLVKDQQFSAVDIHQIQIAFRQHALNGYVTKEKFKLVLGSLGLNSMPIDRMYELFDKDGDNQVDYKEFLLGFGTLRDDNAETIKFCFDLFDTDNSGYISREELGAMFTYLASESNEKDCLERAERIADLFEKLDSNSDNRISFEEFQQGVETEPELKNAFIRPAKRKFRVISSKSPTISPCSTAKVPEGSSQEEHSAKQPKRKVARSSSRPTLHIAPAVSSDLFFDVLDDVRIRQDR